jgi:hypothetical protein
MIRKKIFSELFSKKLRSKKRCQLKRRPKEQKWQIVILILSGGIVWRHFRITGTSLHVGQIEADPGAGERGGTSGASHFNFKELFANYGDVRRLCPLETTPVIDS